MAVDRIFPFCYNTCIDSKKEPKMQVRELIQILSQLDGESEVMGSYNGGEYESDLSMLEVEVDQDGVVWLRD